MTRRPVLLPWLGALLFLLLPGHPLAFVSGPPWTPLALGCAVVAGIGLFAAWSPPSSRWLTRLGVGMLVLALLKLLLALTAPRYGLEARYYANERFHNQPESSTIAVGLPYTRLDTLFEFGSDEFPLYFFNDSQRFNSLGSDRLDRGKNLTWSARWSGFLHAPADAPVSIWLTASGPGELRLDGAPLLKVDADGRATAQRQVSLTRGPHQLDIRYARKKERSGLLKVETDLSGQRAPLGAPSITAEAYPAGRLELDRAVTLAARAVDGGFLGLLAGLLALSLGSRLRAPLAAGTPRLARWERPLLALVVLGFFLEATLPRLDRFGKMVFLGGGQDWLTHETLAREIMFNGLLIALGKPLGQGDGLMPQPLYLYYLALLHRLSGEDLFGVIALQMVGLGVSAVLVYHLARRLFGRLVALVALALMLGVLVPFELAWVSRRLLTEALYFWLLPAAVLAMVVLAQRAARASARRPSTRLAVLAGVLLGAACLSRGPTLLYVPPAMLLIWLALRRSLPRPAASRLLLVFSLSAALVIALLPLRNLIVTGKPALTAASGGINLEKFHRPSDAVRLSRIDDDPLYQVLSVDRPTQEVIEYLRQDPVGYFSSYLPLALYTLGIGSAMNHLLDERPVQLHPDLLILNALYLTGLLLARRARGLEAGLLHAFIATHFATMVIFAPYDYENRLVMPMYVVMVVISAAGLVELGRLAARLALRLRSNPSASQAPQRASHAADVSPRAQTSNPTPWP